MRKNDDDEKMPEKPAKSSLRNEHDAIAALMRLNWDKLTAAERESLAAFAPEPLDKDEAPAAG